MARVPPMRSLSGMRTDSFPSGEKRARSGARSAANHQHVPSHVARVREQGRNGGGQQRGGRPLLHGQGALHDVRGAGEGGISYREEGERGEEKR
ncbi:hypothetical protein TNIN_61351 [Trichonephila inaurata madagascariensis]|uniref:Uncharacterized protein n=1 Tax=Trichonephila inaurata madagascariensis TaxID=2747483 RepID=A0A8X6MJJ3_9ARAC|nr:hypothetical protein TNIN_61351 [Trichonephila inaurata madagascariensis]